MSVVIDISRAYLHAFCKILCNAVFVERYLRIKGKTDQEHAHHSQRVHNISHNKFGWLPANIVTNINLCYNELTRCKIQDARRKLQATSYKTQDARCKMQVVSEIVIPLYCYIVK